jgi:phage shock protein A
VEDLKTLHDQSLQAAGQAKQAVERNALVLQGKIAERAKLLSQLEQAKMQEQVSASLQSMSELAAPGNTPSLDEVRDKIERRYANAVGSAELAQIRASMRGAPVAGEVTAGEPAPQPASPQQALPPHSQPQPGQG